MNVDNVEEVINYLESTWIPSRERRVQCGKTYMTTQNREWRCSCRAAVDGISKSEFKRGTNYYTNVDEEENKLRDIVTSWFDQQSISFRNKFYQDYIYPAERIISNWYKSILRLAGGQIVALKTSHGSWVTTESRYNSFEVVNTRTSQQPNLWEFFVLDRVDSQQIALRSFWDRYVQALPNERVVADRKVSTGHGAWERFELIPRPNDKVAFLNREHNKYLTAEHSGKMSARRDVGQGVDSWEEFILVTVEL